MGIFAGPNYRQIGNHPPENLSDVLKKKGARVNVGASRFNAHFQYLTRQHFSGKVDMDKESRVCPFSSVLELQCDAVHCEHSLPSFRGICSKRVYFTTVQHTTSG